MDWLACCNWQGALPLLSGRDRRALPTFKGIAEVYPCLFTLPPRAGTSPPGKGIVTRIEDELGKFYWVDKGDPAFPYVQKLLAKHYSWIVLPRGLILGWNDKPGRWWWCQPLRMARRMGYTSNEGRRALRLAECLQALEG